MSVLQHLSLYMWHVIRFEVWFLNSLLFPSLYSYPTITNSIDLFMTKLINRSFKFESTQNNQLNFPFFDLLIQNFSFKSINMTTENFPRWSLHKCYIGWQNVCLWISGYSALRRDLFQNVLPYENIYSFSFKYLYWNLIKLET